MLFLGLADHTNSENSVREKYVSFPVRKQQRAEKISI